MFGKKAAERTQALKTDFEADVGHRQSAGGQQFLSFFDPALGQVLMWCFVKGLAEESQKVKA